MLSSTKWLKYYDYLASFLEVISKNEMTGEKNGLFKRLCGIMGRKYKFILPQFPPQYNFSQNLTTSFNVEIPSILYALRMSIE